MPLEGDGYVDEGEEIREEISELNRQVATYPGKPSDSQTQRLAVLSGKVSKVESSFKTLTGEKMNAINSLLEKAEMKKLEMETMETFLEKS